MAIDERSRHILFLKLEEVLGSEEATILMEHLPPVGWADVATKRDLDALAVAFRRDLDSLRLDFKATQEANRLEHEVLKQTIEASKQEVLATLRAEMVHQTRTMFFGMITTLAAFGGLVLAAVRLFA